jgi:hypothetical protein
MSTRPDPLEDRDLRPDRLHYATGAMLDREDFLHEQLYHRGRLARALASLHGSGTVAGLRAEVRPLGETEELLNVTPGLAVDRLGRLVEVPRPACLRLGRWMEHLARTDRSALAAARYDLRPGSPIRTGAPGPDDPQHDPTDRQRAFAAKNPTPKLPKGDKDDAPPKDEPPPEWAGWINGYVVADVFLAFAACERGKTPAFATGPFDALDAVQPSRVRDGYELTLAPRAHAIIPPDPWSTVSGAGVEARMRAAQRQIMDEGWREADDEWQDRTTMAAGAEHPPEVDPSSVFLARLFVPVGTDGVSRDLDRRILVNNHLRPFVYPGPALAWLARQ